jgi:hypothetical protein
MTIPVTLNLPEDLYRRAERFARLANCDVQSVLADTLTHSLPTVSAAIDTLPLISELDDAQVVPLCKGWRKRGYLFPLVFLANLLIVVMDEVPNGTNMIL